MSQDPNPPAGRNRPPIEHRFVPNRSGNRRGRPKGALGVKTIVQRIAREQHPVKEGGETRRLSTVDLLLRTLRARAMSGDLQAARLFDRFCERYSPPPPDEGCGLLIVPDEMEVEVWIKQQEALNLIRTEPPEA